jgi:hypothetical protein
MPADATGLAKHYATTTGQTVDGFIHYIPYESVSADPRLGCGCAADAGQQQQVRARVILQNLHPLGMGRPQADYPLLHQTEST